MTTPMAKRESISSKGLVTLQDIAERCGVKKNLVSRALRGLEHISPAKRAHVLQVAEEMGYNPMQHDAARRLALRKNGQNAPTNVIALYLPLPENSTPAHQYTNEIYQGLLHALKSAGYSALVTTTDFRQDGVITLPPPFHRGHVDGLITMFQSFSCYPLYAALRALPTFSARPILNLMHAVRGANFVGADDQAGAYAATAHLLALGHRHLLLFVDQVLGTVETARIAGAREAFCEQGLDPTYYLHQYPVSCGGVWWLDPDPKHFTTPEGEVPELELAARRQLAEYLRAHPEITALLAQNDTNARHAWYTINAMGLRVPENISLIGFDDVDPILDDQGHNLLTSVCIPLYDIGRTAGNTIIRHLEDPTLPDEEIILPTTLVVRASTGPAPRG